MGFASRENRNVDHFHCAPRVPFRVTITGRPGRRPRNEEKRNADRRRYDRGPGGLGQGGVEQRKREAKKRKTSGDDGVEGSRERKEEREKERE